MLQADQIARQERRLSGEAHCPQAKVPSYQDLLDQALDDTFPASDPPAIGAATHVHEPRTTARDCFDWTLRPGACPPVGQAGDDGEGRRRSARADAWLRRELVVGERRIRVGPCAIEQSAETATLIWQEDGGRPQRLEVALEALRRWLADGALEWPEEP